MSLTQHLVYLAAATPTPSPKSGGTNGVNAASLNWTGIASLVALAIALIVILVGLGISARSGKGDLKGAGQTSGTLVVGLIWVAVGVVVGGAGLLGLFGGLAGGLINSGG